MFACRKVYTDFPAAHRQPNHKGHCALIHGHNWSFEFEFKAGALDSNQFVLDFGELSWLKQWLTHMFDHTLLLCANDPLILTLQQAQYSGMDFAEIRTMESTSCEGIARYVHSVVAPLVYAKYPGRVWLSRVTVYEDSKNSAYYE